MSQKENANQPSAPLEHEELQREAPHPVPESQLPYPVSAPPMYGSTSDAYQQPPPSYQDALNYPQIDTMPKVNVTQVYRETIISQPLQVPPPPPPGPQSQPQIVHTIITTNIPSSCMWCSQGIVRNETDLCCLICLIILAVCTFPLGLVLLCCIPCTVRYLLFFIDLRVLNVLFRFAPDAVIADVFKIENYGSKYRKLETK